MSTEQYLRLSQKVQANSADQFFSNLGLEGTVPRHRVTRVSKTSLTLKGAMWCLFVHYALQCRFKGGRMWVLRPACELTSVMAWRWRMAYTVDDIIVRPGRTISSIWYGYGNVIVDQ